MGDFVGYSDTLYDPVCPASRGPCDTERVQFTRAERGNFLWFESRKRILLLPITGGEFRQDNEALTHPVAWKPIGLLSCR